MSRTIRLARIELAHLEGTRPRHAGKNARLDDHGNRIRLPLARVTADDGSTGFGPVRASHDRLAALIGAELDGVVDPSTGVRQDLREIEYPILDLMARREGVPVFRLLKRHDAAIDPATAARAVLRHVALLRRSPPRVA